MSFASEDYFVMSERSDKIGAGFWTKHKSIDGARRRAREIGGTAYKRTVKLVLGVADEILLEELV